MRLKILQLPGKIWGAAIFSIVVASAAVVGLNHALAVKIIDKKAAAEETSEPIDAKNYKPVLIMGDTGIAGFPRDKAFWFKDYTHHGWRFARLFRKDAPYYNQDEWRAFLDDLQMHLAKLRDYGFNAVEIPAYIELVDFSDYGVYSAHPQYSERHRVFRSLFSEIINLAKKFGIRVVFTTDMVALSGPLRDFLERERIGLDIENPRFWEIYASGLEELFRNFPELWGLMIRIGEAGRIYSQEGWDYWSELLVRTNGGVQKMLRTFLAVAEKYNRKIIFRSWAVGIGEVGKMHTVPEAYLKVLEGIESPALIVSTKYNRGDFWTHLPLNPTLFVGKETRIVEFQTRREFEAFTIFPNYVAPHYQHAYRRFLKDNPHLAGAWIWSHSGGPLFQGPFMFYLREGLWQWMDANLYATAQLIHNPSADIHKITENWIKNTFGDHPEVLREISHILLRSHELTAAALTFIPFAKKQAFALGQEIPTVAFSYWNIVGGNSSIFSHLYLLARDDLENTIRQDEENQQKIREMKDRFLSIQNKTRLEPKTRQLMADSFDYWENLAKTLGAYRSFFLRYFAWLDGRGSRQAWQRSLQQFQNSLAQHREKYQGNYNFPAYNFTEALRLVDFAEKSTTTAWLGRVWLLLTLLLLLILVKTPQYFERIPFGLVATGFLVYIFATVMLFSAFRGVLLSTLVLALAAVFVLGIKLLFPHDARRLAQSLIPAFALALLFTGFVAVRGSWYFWTHFWITPAVRSAFVFVLAVVVLASYPFLGWLWRRPLTLPLLGIAGVQLIVMALILLLFGLNETITAINNELAVLPYFLTLIHGIVTHLNIPTALPHYLLAAGVVLVIPGIITLAKRKTLVNG